ncbi:MAG TPA: hypothetical protein VMW86_05525, partial [Dehalococcoidales bacterium]|nr:hypothetical protein [Dehalococcoidales bacterium]
MRKTIFILLCTLGVFSLLAGCAGEPQEPGNGHGETETPEENGIDETETPEENGIDETETPELIEAELQLGFW